MIFFRGNLKATSLWEKLKKYNCQIQNVYPESDLLQDFLFSFLYGLWALHLTLSGSNYFFSNYF